MKLSKFGPQFMAAAAMLNLSTIDKTLIEDRFVNVVRAAETDYDRTTILYILLTNIITCGGVLLVAFLSLEKINIVSENTGKIFFWLSWAISVIVTVSHKSLFAFNIPRKYILNILTLEKYKSEGWQFIAGISRYKHCKTHSERVKVFCARVEKIKLKSLELFASVEGSKSNDGGANNGNTHLTADQPQETTSTHLTIV